MPAYAIFVKERTTNQAELDIYAQKAGASGAGHALTRRAVYGRHEVLEGPPIEGAVVLEFPTFEEARAWYQSPAYQDAVKHRWAGAEYRAFIIEGLKQE